MKQYLSELLDPSVSDKSKVIILEKISSKDFSPQELAAIVENIYQTKTFGYEFPGCLDVVGTGGSGLPRINISTPVSVLLARYGLKVAKHGNNAASGRVGSFDVLDETDLPIASNNQEIQEHLKIYNRVFLHAKRLYPVMKQLAGPRKRYGKPTIFNLIGPLLHPLRPATQFIGCSSRDKMSLMLETAILLGRETVAVVRAQDGLDKISLTGPTDILLYKNNTLTEMIVGPADFDMDPVESFDEIAGGDVTMNAQIMKDILSGQCKTRHKDLIAANAAFVLWMCDKVDTLSKGVKEIRAYMK